MSGSWLNYSKVESQTDADGEVERYKARLVAQGFLQKFRTDYDETFCPAVRLESLRKLAQRFDIKDVGMLHHFSE